MQHHASDRGEVGMDNREAALAFSLFGLLEQIFFGAQHKEIKEIDYSWSRSAVLSINVQLVSTGIVYAVLHGRFMLLVH